MVSVIVVGMALLVVSALSFCCGLLVGTRHEGGGK